VRTRTRSRKSSGSAYENEEARLIVELDGTTHEGKEQHDLTRQEKLEALGYTVPRFRNHEVYENLEGFL